MLHVTLGTFKCLANQVEKLRAWTSSGKIISRRRWFSFFLFWWWFTFVFFLCLTFPLSVSHYLPFFPSEEKQNLQMFKTPQISTIFLCQFWFISLSPPALEGIYFCSGLCTHTHHRFMDQSWIESFDLSAAQPWGEALIWRRSLRQR